MTIPASASRRTAAGGSVARKHDDGGALFGRRGHLRPEPGGTGVLDQVLGQRHGAPANLPHAELLDHLEPAELRVDRHERRCAGLEPARVVVELQRPGIEPELLAMREPSARPRAKRRQQLGPGIHECHAGAAEQPLEAAAAVEVDIERAYVHRELARRLVAVHQEQGAFPVDRLGQGPDVLDGAAGEADVARGHDRRPVIHGPDDGVDRHPDPIGALDHHDLDPLGGPREPLVRDGRKIEARHHHLRPAADSRATPLRRSKRRKCSDAARSSPRPPRPAARSASAGPTAPTTRSRTTPPLRASPISRETRSPWRATGWTALPGSSCSGRSIAGRWETPPGSPSAALARRLPWWTI